MVTYSLLLSPSSNRVYSSAAPRLSVAELAFLNDAALEGGLSGIEAARPFGADVVSFAAAEPLGSDALAVIASLSAAFTLFEHVGDLLRPVPLTSPQRWPDDLVTIQRYPGKTNEQFTRLLVNLALGSARGSAAFTGTKFRVLDPVCGRGTTLNQAVLLGHDAAGVDMDKGDIAGYTTFFTTWLKDKRAKHSVRSVGKATTFSFAVDKEAEKSDRTQQVVVIEGDTMSLGAHISKGTCDVIVADLPYGVQHAGKTGGVTRRSPIDLLNAALPVWRLSLRTGGAMALAFNRRTLSIDDATAVAESAGLRVVQSALGPDAFVHRVDHSIERDVLILQR